MTAACDWRVAVRRPCGPAGATPRMRTFYGRERPAAKARRAAIRTFRVCTLRQRQVPRALTSRRPPPSGTRTRRALGFKARSHRLLMQRIWAFAHILIWPPRARLVLSTHSIWPVSASPVSSRRRRLEQEARRNLELMWLVGRGQAPRDFSGLIWLGLAERRLSLAVRWSG